MKKTPPSTSRSETCCICDRVRWGAWQSLGFGKWRHEECYPGSKSWVEHYYKVGARDEVGDLLLAHHEQKVAERKEKRETTKERA